MMAGEFASPCWTGCGGAARRTDPRILTTPHSTVQATVIHGGTAVNIFGPGIRVTWAYRRLPRPRPERDHRADQGPLRRLGGGPMYLRGPRA